MASEAIRYETFLQTDGRKYLIGDRPAFSAKAASSNLAVWKLPVPHLWALLLCCGILGRLNQLGLLRGPTIPRVDSKKRHHASTRRPGLSGMAPKTALPILDM